MNQHHFKEHLNQFISAIQDYVVEHTGVVVDSDKVKSQLAGEVERTLHDETQFLTEKGVIQNVVHRLLASAQHLTMETHLNNKIECDYIENSFKRVQYDTKMLEPLLVGELNFFML